MNDNNFLSRAQYIRTGNELNKDVDTYQFIEGNKKKIDYDQTLEELSHQTDSKLSGSVVRQSIIDQVGTVRKDVQTVYINNTAVIVNASKSKDDDEDDENKKDKKTEVDEKILAVQNKGKVLADNIRNSDQKGVVPDSLKRKVS